MTREEVWETIRKHDPEYYEYLSKNAWDYGLSTVNYAEYLKRRYENETSHSANHQKP